ncbi:MAG: hypothetical protein PHU23_04360, partial [Dehalococcoidales bacterium]|nr:hypothetical protein [Dehalococcoidales bacterium]
QPPQPLVALAGGRQMVRELMPPGYKPGTPDSGTNVLARAEIALSDLPSVNVSEKDGVRLVVIGKIAEPLEGCACPMGVLGREFLGKLRLADREIVLADMEAGIEHFGRGVETGLDSVLVVVEPSFESIVLAGRIQELAKGIGIQRVWAVLNKVNSDEVAAKLTGPLAERGVEVIGTVPYDEAVFAACLEGRPLLPGRGKLADCLHDIVDRLLRQA